MRRLMIIAAALLLFLPAATAHQTVDGTSHTGKTEVYGIPTLPCTDDVHVDPVHVGVDPADQISMPAYRDLVPDCLIAACPQDIYLFTVTLELVDPSPGDAVSISVVGDLPGLGSWSMSDAIAAPTSTYPSAVATHDDPVAEVTVQLGGCNRATTVVVQGILVDGDVDYRLTY